MRPNDMEIVCWVHTNCRSLEILFFPCRHFAFYSTFIFYFFIKNLIKNYSLLPSLCFLSFFVLLSHRCEITLFLYVGGSFFWEWRHAFLTIRKTSLWNVSKVKPKRDKEDERNKLWMLCFPPTVAFIDKAESKRNFKEFSDSFYCIVFIEFRIRNLKHTCKKEKFAWKCGRRGS